MFNVQTYHNEQMIEEQIEAKTAGSAARKFARKHGITLKTDIHSGGWIGVFVTPVNEHRVHLYNREEELNKISGETK